MATWIHWTQPEISESRLETDSHASTTSWPRTFPRLTSGRGPSSQLLKVLIRVCGSEARGPRQADGISCFSDAVCVCGGKMLDKLRRVFSQVSDSICLMILSKLDLQVSEGSFKAPSSCLRRAIYWLHGALSPDLFSTAQRVLSMLLHRNGRSSSSSSSGFVWLTLRHRLACAEKVCIPWRVPISGVRWSAPIPGMKAVWVSGSHACSATPTVLPLLLLAWPCRWRGMLNSLSFPKDLKFFFSQPVFFMLIGFKWYKAAWNEWVNFLPL